MAIRITQNRKVRARCDLAYRLCVPNPLIFRLICTVSAYFCFLAVPAIAAVEETKNVKAKDLHVCGVSPEVLEERSFEDASSKIYSLSTNPEGKKCLTLIVTKDGGPELRYLGSLKKLDDLTISEIESLIGIIVDTRLPFVCQLYGWNGQKSILFRFEAKFLKGRLWSYKVLGDGINQAKWQLVKRSEEQHVSDDKK